MHLDGESVSPIRAAARDQRPAPRLAKPHVLFVEDEPLLSDVVMMDLEDSGFLVTLAENGDRALEIVGYEAEIALLFTDIRLPGSMDGWTLAERARSLRPELPVLYATGYSVAQPRQVEGSLLIMKPYRLATVLDAARRLGVEPNAG